MKQLAFRLVILALAVITSAEFTSCKDKKKNTTTTNTTRTDTTTAPVEVSSDAALQDGLRDATKDYPGVTATVKDGEVTLTGTIERDRLQKLLESVNNLKPKKVNNQLTIK